MKRRGYMILLALVLVSLVCVGFFWDAIAVRIAPRLVLGNAIAEAFEKLEDRFEDSPIHLLEDALDPRNQQASLKLETKDKYLGTVCYDMALRTQLAPNRILAQGNVITGGKMLDLSLYLDKDFGAVASEGLVGGNFYGITYDTFSRDIRSWQFLAALIGEKKISEWEESTRNLGAIFSQELILPEFTAEDIQKALYAALALKPQVERVSTPAGGAKWTDTVSFVTTGQAIAQAAEPYRSELPPEILSLIEGWKQDPQAFVKITFFLYKGHLVEVHLNFEDSEGTARMFVTLGKNPEKSPLSLDFTQEKGEDLSIIRLKIETFSDDVAYREKINLTRSRNGVQRNLSADYSFDLSTQEMDLTLVRNDQKARVRLNLQGEGESLTLRSQDITPLLNLFRKKHLENPAICTLTLSPGEPISVPEYRNLDRWSAEDLLEILAGLGGLLGLKLP